MGSANLIGRVNNMTALRLVGVVALAVVATSAQDNVVMSDTSALQMSVPKQVPIGPLYYSRADGTITANSKPLSTVDEYRDALAVLYRIITKYPLCGGSRASGEVIPTTIQWQEMK